VRLLEHPGPVSVVRLPAGATEPGWARGGPLVSVTRTPEELSVVCPSAAVPEQLPGPVQGPFSAFEVEGPLDFDLTGVLAGLLRPLADAGISVFALSTFETDWVLVAAGSAAPARAAWAAAGHAVAAQPDHQPDQEPDHQGESS
jgi:hypothetical protein